MSETLTFQRFSRVLIVGEEAALCQRLIELLQSEGFEAKTCGTVLEMQRELERGEFGVALLNRRLLNPEEPGLLERLRASSPTVPIIVPAELETALLEQAPVDSRWAGEFLLSMHRALHRQFVSYATDLETRITQRAGALRESEARFRRIVETTIEGIWTLDVDGRVDYVNQRVAEMLGYSTAEMLHRDVLDFHFPDDFAGGRARIERRKAGIRETFPVRLRRQDGTELRVEASASPILDESGKYCGVLSIFSDVTDRFRAEEAARRNLELFQLGADAVPAYISYVDADERYQMVNQRYEEWFQRPRDQFIGKQVGEIHGAAAYAKMRDPIGRVLAGEVVHYENPLKSTDGGIRTFDTTYVPHRDASGEVLGFFVMVFDITERRHMEDELLRRARELRSITDNVPDIIVRADRNLRFLYANRQIEAASGQPAASFLGRTTSELGLPPALCAYWDGHGKKIFESGEPALMEFTSPSPTGLRHFEAYGIPEFGLDNQVETILGIARDVTERKRAEDDRRRLETQMQQSQKSESLGVLAGGVAHDFNNLLQAILSNADVALASLPSESPARQSLHRIEVAAQRAAELTNLMLAYAGKGKFRIEPLDLSQLTLEMVQLLGSSISKKADLQARCASPLPAVEGDASQLRQVVMNLITNASEALGERGGVIRVTTGLIHTAAENLEAATPIRNLPEGDYVFLEVADNGCGLAADVRDRIFEPFFSTKSPGRGLGLAAVSGIIQSHRGGILLESEPDAGTTIRVLLPACNRAAMVSGAASRTPTPQSNAGRTILVVDDEAFVRDVTRALLEGAGYTVLAVTGGLEALELCGTATQPIDAVLLDLTMPDMDGSETFRELQRMRPRLPVLLTSGYMEEEATSQFQASGLAGFIQKPYRAAQLLEALRRVLGAPPPREAGSPGISDPEGG
jgi:PAS domain S-box-containing protein